MSRPWLAAALTLGAIVVVATGLRFWRLDVPPIWLDESVTALIAAGRGPDQLPIGRVFPLAHVADVFDPRVSVTTGEALAVFRDPRVQDLHPPTYHLLSNLALRAGLRSQSPLIPRVRALAVLFGIAAVVAMYFAARQAFDPMTALTAAALVAVSPYAVMLSREARNYSLAMLLVTLALGATLAIAKRIADRRPARGWWIAWAALCAMGLYVHYFVLFACLAQAAALAYVALRARSTAAVAALATAATAVFVAFLPLLPKLVAHQASPEQRWLRFELYGSTPIEVPYRIASAWQTMLLGKAWDVFEPLRAISRFSALVIFICAAAAVVYALYRTSSISSEERSVRLLAAIVGMIVVEYVAAIVLQGKDFVSQVRYQVVYYPSFAMMVAWVFARRLRPAAIAVLLAAGIVNSVMVDLDFESWKGTDPPPVMARLGPAPRPALIVAGVGSFNEIVVHGGLLLELIRRTGAEGRAVAFVQRTEAYASFDVHADPAKFWRNLSRLRPHVLPSSVLVHSSGMLSDEYKPSFTITSESGGSALCTGVTLRDPVNASDNVLMHPAYRRYECESAAADGAH